MSRSDDGRYIIVEYCTAARTTPYVTDMGKVIASGHPKVRDKGSYLELSSTYKSINNTSSVLQKLRDAITIKCSCFSYGIVNVLSTCMWAEMYRQR